MKYCYFVISLYEILHNTLMYLHKCGMRWEDYRLPKSLHVPIILLSSHLKKKAENQNTKYYKRWELGYEQLSGPRFPLKQVKHDTISASLFKAVTAISVCIYKNLTLSLEIKGLIVVTFLICLNLPNFCAPLSLKLQPRGTMAVHF